MRTSFHFLIVKNCLCLHRSFEVGQKVVAQGSRLMGFGHLVEGCFMVILV